MTWGNDLLRLDLGIGPAAPVRILALGRTPSEPPRRAPRQPLVEILAVGHGHAKANLRNTATAVGDGLRYVRHEVSRQDHWATVRIVQRNEAVGVLTTSTLRMPDTAAAVQCVTTVRNESDEPIVLQAVTSLAIGDPLGVRPPRELDLLTAYSDWVGEGRWEAVPLSSQAGMPNLDLPAHQRQDARGAYSIVSHSTWSSGERVPAGALTVRGGGAALAWQIEHNGAWRAELGERLGDDAASEVVLGLMGPTDQDHQWLKVLAPGEEFTTVPVALAFAETGWQEAVAELTAYRRALRGLAAGPLPVVFNDYMNTLMGDPTTDKLTPLVEAAAAAGAEYFCIDAGWYDDGGDWWDSVGEWLPSTTRFTGGGLTSVLEHIRRSGMVPGLWLEPEVIGQRSVLASSLPDAAFLQRGGRRIRQDGRYLLDLRHPDAVKHLDEVVDRLVDDLGVGYFKLDYNVTPGVGTDRDADSAGAGLLAHNRAHLDWLDGVMERHPGLLIENCASGGMRADYAILSRLHLQSTSDQQNPLLYPPVAASAPMSILPEQAGNWAYPQPEMTTEEIVFTLCTGLSGRIYLSGRLDRMSGGQLDHVREAVAFARATREHQAAAVPRWPLGLPAWDAEWVASALATPDRTYLTVWYRGSGPGEITVPMEPGEIEMAFPADGADGVGAWEIVRLPHGQVRLRVPGGPQARVLRIERSPDSRT